MSPRQEWNLIRRRWLVAVMSYSLLIAPFGCTLEGDLFGGLFGPPTNLAEGEGLFVNDDFDDNLVAAAKRGSDGLFVYGSRGDNGELNEVDSIVVKSGAQQAFITFELGRPVHIQAVDGSYLAITYDEVSTSRLAGTAELYDADAGEKTYYAVDIDLTRSADAVANDVENASDEEVVVPDEDDVSFAAAKVQNREVGAILGGLIVAAVVIPIVILANLSIVVLGQVFTGIFSAVGAAIQATLVLVFYPFFLLGDLLSATAPASQEEDVRAVFDAVPEPPVVNVG